MNLSLVITQLECECELELITRQQYRRAVSRFEAFLNRIATTEDLKIDVVNAWILWLQDNLDLGAVSVRNHRSGLIRVWNYCSDTLGIVEPCNAKRIRRPKQPPTIVRAWSLTELDILLQSAASIKGFLRCGIAAKDFLLAWLWVGYETAFRPGDLRLLTWANVDFKNSSITIVQHKTRSVQSMEIGPESLQALEELRRFGQERVFPLDKFGVYRWEKMLYAEAEKLGFQHRARQGLGTLRKTHATEIYRQYGLEAAAESLGHRSGTNTVRNHYVDSRERTKIRPPRPKRA